MQLRSRTLLATSSSRALYCPVYQGSDTSAPQGGAGPLLRRFASFATTGVLIAALSGCSGGSVGDPAGQDGTTHEGVAVLPGGQLAARRAGPDEREVQRHVRRRLPRSRPAYRPSRWRRRTPR